MLTVSPKTIIKTSIKLALLPNNFVVDKILVFQSLVFQELIEIYSVIQRLSAKINIMYTDFKHDLNLSHTFSGKSASDNFGDCKAKVRM